MDNAHEALQNRNQARLDDLVARQPHPIREAVDRVFGLPNIRHDQLYEMFTRTPEVFILFLERQLRFQELDVHAVDCPEPTYTEPDSLERDFYAFRSAFSVHLHFHGLRLDELHNPTHPEYDFLVVVPPDSDNGLEIATSMDQVFGAARMFLNPGTYREPQAADFVLLLRQALPNAEVMLDSGFIRHYPENFFLFANSFLQAAETARPGIFATFAANGDTARSFILSMMDLFIGGNSRPRISADGGSAAQAHRTIRATIVQLMPDIGDLYNRAIAQFRRAPPREELTASMPLLGRDPRALLDTYDGFAETTLFWNHNVFTNYFNDEVMPFMDNDDRRDQRNMYDLRQELHDIETFHEGGIVMVPRADYVDVEFAVMVKRSYEEMPVPPKGGQTTSGSTSSSDDSQGDPRCIFCTRVLGGLRPKREPAYTFPCGHVHGIDCIRHWIREKETEMEKMEEENRVELRLCPNCRARITSPPSPESPPPNTEFPRNSESPPPPRNAESPTGQDPVSAPIRIPGARTPSPGDSDRISSGSSNPLSLRSLSMASSDLAIFGFTRSLTPENGLPVVRDFAQGPPEPTEPVLPQNERPARPDTPRRGNSPSSSDTSSASMLSFFVPDADFLPVFVVDSPWPEDAPATLDDRHHWFERVFIPMATLTYFGRTHRDPQAFRTWLSTIRPLVQQALLQDRENIALTRIINM